VRLPAPPVTRPATAETAARQARPAVVTVRT
jgi:hypothetical protein